jgi:hypothetical protein
MLKDRGGVNFLQILLKHMVLDQQNHQPGYWMTCSLSKKGALPVLNIPITSIEHCKIKKCQIHAA